MTLTPATEDGTAITLAIRESTNAILAALAELAPDNYSRQRIRKVQEACTKRLKLRIEELREEELREEERDE